MIKPEPWTGGVDEEYENQHFGFGAQRFKIAMRQMIEQKIITGIKGMEVDLLQSLNLNETDKVTLEQSCNKLIRLYCERARPNMEIIDGEIQRLFEIPRSVLLQEDESQANEVSEDECERLKEEVASLRKEVAREALMEVLLTAQHQELSSVANECKVAAADMQALDSIQERLRGNEERIKANIEEVDSMSAICLLTKNHIEDAK